MSALREAIYRIRNHEATGMVGAENLAQLAEKELAELEFELRRAIEANSGFVEMNNLHIRRIAELEDALQEIKQWGEAYPLEVFPEPDFVKARELLKAGGQTLDAISAHNMRHVVTRVSEIVRKALATSPEEQK